MTAPENYDKYPFWIVLLSNAHSLGIYFLGVFIMFYWHWIAALVYFFYILFMEYRLLKYHCPNCYYHGKVCGFGKGLVSSWFFKKGDVSEFSRKEMTWKDMIPDIMVSLIPLITGIIFLFIFFDFPLLFAVLLLILLTSYGNAFIRSCYTCKFCKQMELGCPAEKLFNREKE